LPWLPVLSHTEPPAFRHKAAVDGLVAKATVHHTTTLANIAHTSLVWHGASERHFSMAWWLDFGFCGQLWLSPQSYYPSSRIRSAKETVVYSIASEQTKDTVVPLRQRPT